MENHSTNCAGRDAGDADDPITARIRGLIDLQRKIDARVSEWMRNRGPGTEGYLARLTIEVLRTLILRKIAELSASGEPVSADDVSCLALALARVESADKSRIAREQAAGTSDIPPIPVNPTYPAESHFVSVNPSESQLIPLCPAESHLSH